MLATTVFYLFIYFFFFFLKILPRMFVRTVFSTMVQMAHVSFSQQFTIPNSEFRSRCCVGVLRPFDFFFQVTSGEVS